MKDYVVKNLTHHGARKMAQQLKALVAFAEVKGLGHITHMVCHDPSLHKLQGI